MACAWVALRFAVDKGELTRNVAKLATLPRPTDDVAHEELGPVRSLTEDREQRFLAAAARDRLKALWYLLLDAGLRPGESFALKWEHVDRVAQRVRVRYTLRRVGVKGWKLTPPKTRNSKRDVPISNVTLAALEEWAEQQAGERERVGAEWQDHGFVFTTEVGSPLGNNVGRAWARVLREADGGRGDLGTWGDPPRKPRSGPTPERRFTPSVRLYILRHTSATLPVKRGEATLLEVSRRLGHSDYAFTARIYSHLQAEDTVAVAASFDRRAASLKRLALVS